MNATLLEHANHVLGYCVSRLCVVLLASVGPVCCALRALTWLVRMYMPLGVLITSTVSPAGILLRGGGAPPDCDCVLVLVPGITISATKKHESRD